MFRHHPLDLLKQQAFAARLAHDLSPRAAVERLEDRRLLAASISGRVLTVLGGGGNDAISLTRSGAGGVIANVNGAKQTFDSDDFDRVVVRGGGGSDTITNGNGIERVTLDGGSGNDRLTDGNGSNTLQGSDGNDTLVAGAGDDSLSGGAGRDMADYSARTTAIDFDIDTNYREPDVEGTITTEGETDTLAHALFEPDPDDYYIPDGDPVPDTEIFIGTELGDDFDLHITTDLPPVHFVFDGRGGNDSFGARGYGGPNISYTAFGGDGDDIFGIGERVPDTLYGGAGNDRFFVEEDSGPGRVDGGAGTDEISYALHGTAEVIDLNDLTSVENASSSQDGVLLIGTPGNNRLEVSGSGTIRGGAGDDTLIGGGYEDEEYIVLLQGEQGNDLLYGVTDEGPHDNDAPDAPDTLDGGDGVDTIVGERGNDVFRNAEVHETRRVGIFFGVLYGEATDGDDLIELARTASGDVALTINGVSGVFEPVEFYEARLHGFGGNDRIVVGDGIAESVWLFGGEGNDRLLDGDGANTLYGDAGNDTLVSGLGRDHMSGGDGRDTADYSARTAALVIGLDDVADDGEVGENDNVRTDIERVLGGGGNDRLGGSGGSNILYGGPGRDTLSGNSGNDALFGEGGHDKIDGGNGDDTLDGGFGADVLFGNAGRDVLSYASRTNRLIVGLDSYQDDGEPGENDFAAPDIERLIGGGGNDRIGGSSSDNVLYGGDGNDTLGGGGGRDALFGEGGNDKLHGDDGDDYLEGGAGHDALQGGAGADTLLALAGNDRLFADGDGRRDVVNGGAGTDSGDVDDLDEVTNVETRS